MPEPAACLAVLNLLPHKVGAVHSFWPLQSRLQLVRWIAGQHLPSQHFALSPPLRREQLSLVEQAGATAAVQRSVAIKSLQQPPPQPIEPIRNRHPAGRRLGFQGPLYRPAAGGVVRAAGMFLPPVLRPVPGPSQRFTARCPVQLVGALAPRPGAAPARQPLLRWISVRLRRRLVLPRCALDSADRRWMIWIIAFNFCRFWMVGHRCGDFSPGRQIIDQHRA